MSSLYEFEKLKDGAGYRFVTFTGDIYIAYLPNLFCLIDQDEIFPLCLDAGDYLTHDEVKKFFADKRTGPIEIITG